MKDSGVKSPKKRGRKSEVKSADQSKHDNGGGIQNRSKLGAT